MGNKAFNFLLGNPPIEISDFLYDLFEMEECRGRVGKAGNISFYIHVNEHNHVVPHIHAECGSYNIVISIEDCSILAGNLPMKSQMKAIFWVKEHKDNLLNTWKNVVISKELKYNQPNIKPY